MGSPPFFLLLSFVFSFPLSASTIVVISRFSTGTSLFVEKPDILISPNRDFSAGFYSVGDNAYCFAIWFSNSRTVVWMANRDNPVNGKHSKLSLFDTGNLILTDATKLNVTVWATNTVSLSSVQLFLNDTGNLVLCDKEGIVLWQSFDFPTDTLLPQQLLTRKTKLVSSRSQTNFSSGFYELSFNNDNLLRLVYNGLDVSDIYWFYSGLEDYNNSILVFNSLGNLSPSDDFTIMSADYGAMLHRRLTLDYDGNIRLYGWEEERQSWVVSWQAIQRPCIIAGACGANSFCSYVIGYGRKCSCPSGYKMKNRSDWADGCELEVELSCKENESGFLMLSHVDFYSYYGNDFGNFLNYTFDQCRDLCLAACDCIAFEYNFNKEAGYSKCYPKTRLLNGYRSPELNGDVYLKLPKSYILSHHNPLEEFNLNCAGDGTLQSGVAKQAYDRAAIGFRKFTYTELKKATESFSEEIGRGAGGIVYKGVLSDNRVAAIKHLNEASQGEDNLSVNVLDWEKRFKIIMGTAKGLAYLHEDCLDWILHCDVKSQNILLDSTYQPKVADFGLSKLQNRDVLKNSSFSKIRGTRGYMAPEWVFNLPITSKVDVYSYGIVVLEMVTGKDPSRSVHAINDGGVAEHKRLVTWVREKMNKAAANTSLLEEIIDPLLEGKYDIFEMKALVQVALQCIEEDKDVRPTMNQVVEMLLLQEKVSDGVTYNECNLMAY
uniref:Receptor-like serine/threonine-protein kinase n=1 Tax=Quercus lobata TaxID=97700 RepID=A0A7N2KRT9_QUELO